jgi:hypothetical protein
MQEMLHQCYTALAAPAAGPRAAELRLTLHDCRLGFNLAARGALTRQLAAAERDQWVADGASYQELATKVRLLVVMGWGGAGGAAGLKLGA